MVQSNKVLLGYQIRLSDQVTKILQKEKLFNLKLNCQKAVEDAELPDYFSCKVKSSDDTDDLLSTLVMSPYWNWIDVRLMESVAVVSDEATFMLKQYKEYLHSQNLVDLLSHIPSIHKDVKVNYKTVTAKMKTKIEEITIKDFFRHRHIFEKEILNLKEGTCLLIHIKKKKNLLRLTGSFPKTSVYRHTSLLKEILSLSTKFLYYLLSLNHMI